ncbi:MAG: HD domain-containing protein, partial [Chloroflexi bacterium]|nr:HD domain-containing protein [Chloroflexota bacterium]
TDVATLEAAANELMNAWERSGYNQRLTTLIQAGISLSTLLEPQAAIREVAIIARQALQARFTFATLIDQDSNFTRVAHAGYAPNLLKSLSTEQASNALLQTALNALQPFRIRDVRKYKHASPIVLDHKMLRGLLVIPVRLHRMSIGAILAFGKQGGIFFSEKDESLASLLASQAAAAIESAWLIQELRTTLSTTTLLYQLSFRVIQAENLKEAARVIAETAYKLAKASVAGIVLFNSDEEIETEVEVSADGTKTTAQYPMTMVEQTLATGQHIVLSSGQSSSQIYIPIQTHLRKYGVLWMEFTENERHVSSQSTTLQTLTNQAAIALERAILLADSRKQAEEIKAAYRELEITYDQTLAALTSALDARDRETEGHSTRVGKIACRLGKDLGLSPTQLKALARGSLLHDIGKIGISDTILHKPGPLNAEEWHIMRQHPKIGTQIVADIPFLQDTLPIIHYHQERWDGSGYPLGLSGTDIPLLARIFAVADAFDALTSNRPYRERISNKEALEFLRKQAGVLFDPDIVAIFDRLISENSISDIIALP